MKKKVWIGTLLAFALLSVSVLLMVACKKKAQPQAPTGLSSYVSGSTIIVSWNSVEDADDYEIRTSNGSFNDGKVVYGTSFTDYSPREGDNHYYVTARNEYGYSAKSETSCYYSGNSGGGSGSSSDLPVPTNVSAEVNGSRVYVTWSGTLNTGYYNIYRSTSSNGPYSEIGYVNHAYTYYYDDAPNSENYYKITSYTYPNESEMSSYAYCYYSGGGGGGGGGGTTVPDAPTGVTATNIGSTMVPDVKITWNSVSNATGYKVYKSTSANSGYTQLGSETTTTYLYDHNPSQGNNYYKVKAFNSAGGSSYSSYAVYNHDPSSQLSPCPVHYTSHTATSTTITLRWSNPTTTGCGTPTSATLRVRNPDSGVYADLQTLSGTATTASFSYGMWADSDGYVYCGIITENSSGTSGGLPLVYNWKTNTWYGGNGKQYTDVMENEEFGFSNIKH